MPCLLMMDGLAQVTVVAAHGSFLHWHDQLFPQQHGHGTGIMDAHLACPFVASWASWHRGIVDALQPSSIIGIHWLETREFRSLVEA